MRTQATLILIYCCLLMTSMSAYVPTFSVVKTGNKTSLLELKDAQGASHTYLLLELGLGPSTDNFTFAVDVMSAKFYSNIVDAANKVDDWTDCTDLEAPLTYNVTAAEFYSENIRTDLLSLITIRDPPNFNITTLDWLRGFGDDVEITVEKNAASQCHMSMKEIYDPVLHSWRRVPLEVHSLWFENIWLQGGPKLIDVTYFVSGDLSGLENEENWKILQSKWAEAREGFQIGINRGLNSSLYE